MTLPRPRVFAFRVLIPLLLLSFLGTGVRAQNGHFEGVWEGTMIVGGLEGTPLPVQLYLTAEGRKVTGRSYVQLPNGEVLQMDLAGHTYRDGSLSLTEIRFAGDPENSIMPEFNRQYQILYKADIWNPELRGYWQEVTEDALNPKRRLGRLRLKRRKADGA